MRSISYLMHYSRTSRTCDDRIGGVPSHLPAHWPRCQTCQQEMGFVGQLYEADWFSLDGDLALQFYVCADCRQSFGGMANDKVPIHLERLSRSAQRNVGGQGVRCKSQPKLFITYEAVDDSMEQSVFQRRRIAEAELSDVHLRQDKIGGLFPYDGYDCPAITKENQMIAQFKWQGIGGPIFVYRSAKKGIYLYYCR